MVVKIMVPFVGTLNIRCRTILGTPKGTILLTTAHMRKPYRGTRKKVAYLGVYVGVRLKLWTFRVELNV